jgi:hypothetical protein
MKQGRFFCIPESPGDVDLLRRQASPLDGRTRPRWLDVVDAEYYRYAGRHSCSGLVGADHDQFLAEIAELELAGLVVDQDSQDPDTRHLYVRSAPDYDIWSIGIYAGNSPLELRPAPRITNPVLTRDDVSDVAAVLVADPFMVREDANWFMFFELLNWRTNKGEIGLATSNDGLHWRYQQRVLVEPFHLSYPYVFRDGHAYYMIPEARQSRSVRLYRAADFPTSWSFVGVLLKGTHLVDASVFRQAGRWWMLVGDTSDRSHDTLRLYFSSSVTGPWAEHPSSPIVIGDPSIARPAGRVIVEEGRVFRFAQNCQPWYGLDVRAFEITDLTPTTYVEVALSASPILAGGGERWKSRGMHHVDAQRCEDSSWHACVDGWTDDTCA